MKFSDMLVKESAPRTNVLDMSQYPHIKDSDLFRVLKQLPPLSVYGPWVAGGSVWRTINKEPLEKCDIDIFFQSQEQHDEVVRKMNSLPHSNNIVKETKNKWNTVYKCHIHERKFFDKTIDVQFINMNFHPNLESLLDSFDLSVCQFGYDGESLRFGTKSLEDLAAKRIRLHSLRLPKTMLKHLHKYLSNGFTISSEETRELTYRLMTMNCWKNSDKPDYDDGDEKEKGESKAYISPFSGGGWEAGAGHAYTTAAINVNAPIVEAEDEVEYDPNTFQARPGRRARRGERIENGGRRNRRPVNADPLQANTGWIPAGVGGQAVWGQANNAAGGGVAQWAPINVAPQPAAPANQPQAVVGNYPGNNAIPVPGGWVVNENPVNEVPIQPVAAERDDAAEWEGYGFAPDRPEPEPNVQPVAQQGVVELRPEPGAFIAPAAQPQQPERNVVEEDWEGFGYAQRVARQNNQQPVAPANNQNARHNEVLNQLEREGLLDIAENDPNREARMNQALNRAEELLRDGVPLRERMYRDAAEQLNRAYVQAQIRQEPVVVAQQQPANPPAARADENEIADGAAQQAERNELRDVFDDFFNA